jgi:ribonuclease P protein component
MLDRTHRFHGLGSLRFVYRQGEITRGQYGAIKYIRNPRRRTWRAAIVVSRKVHKSAVVRNRIRRRVYEVLRELAPQIQGPYDIVLIAYSDSIAAMPSAELRSTLAARLSDAGIISEQPADAHAIVKTKE